jgi:hypothetical protein
LSAFRRTETFAVSRKAVSEKFYSVSDGCAEVKKKLQRDARRQGASNDDDVTPAKSGLQDLFQSVIMTSVQCHIVTKMQHKETVRTGTEDGAEL